MIVEALRQRIRTHQCEEGAAAPVYQSLYECQSFLIDECLPEAEGRPRPLISLEADPKSGWRGKYQRIGPFGVTEVITINALGTGIAEADDLIRVIAHELGHWHVRSTTELRGHTDEWRELVFERFGIVFNEHGMWLRDTGAWWDLCYRMKGSTSILLDYLRA